MKVYMYSEEEAKKSNCNYSYNALPNVLLFLFLIMLVLTISIIVSAYIPFLPWILFLGYLVISLKYVLESIKKRNWCKSTAFIKEDNTLWAVKLTFYFVPTPPVLTDTITTALTLPGAAKSAEISKELSDELSKRRLVEQSYVDALNTAKKSSVHIMEDLDTIFPLVFNGRQSVTRLDNIKFVSENEKTETYTFNDYRGIKRQMVINKAYPGFKEEVLNTKLEEQKYPFPKKYKKSISHNPFYVFLILLGLFIGIPLLIGFIKSIIG